MYIYIYIYTYIHIHIHIHIHSYWQSRKRGRKRLSSTNALCVYMCAYNICMCTYNVYVHTCNVICTYNVYIVRLHCMYICVHIIFVHIMYTYTHIMQTYIQVNAIKKAREEAFEEYERSLNLTVEQRFRKRVAAVYDHHVTQSSIALLLLVNFLINIIGTEMDTFEKRQVW